MPKIRKNAVGDWYIRGILSGKFITWSPLSPEACDYIKKVHGGLNVGLDITINDIHVMIQRGYLPNKRITPDRPQMTFEEIFASSEDVSEDYEGTQASQPGQDVKPPGPETKEESESKPEKPELPKPTRADSDGPQNKSFWKRLADWLQRLFNKSG